MKIKKKLNFALGRENYKLLAIGFGIIVIRLPAYAWWQIR